MLPMNSVGNITPLIFLDIRLECRNNNRIFQLFFWGGGGAGVHKIW